VVCAAAAVTAFFVLSGGPYRDSELIADVAKLGAVVPPHSRIALPAEIAPDAAFRLEAYLYRWDYISAVAHDTPDCFRLELKQRSGDPGGFFRLPVDLLGYRLFEPALFTAGAVRTAVH
jgi:hypothetical protein